MSVIVCVYNEEEHLSRLLRSLRLQDDEGIREVIIVDDGSTDATAAIAEGHGHRVIRCSHRGPARGRNVGAEAATGDILVFLDGDMACSPHFISSLVAPIRRGAVGSFTRDIKVGNLENEWARAYSVMRQLRNGRLLAAHHPDTWDNFRAIRRDAFESVGGNDDVGYGEDRTVAAKLGASAVVAPGAECLHFNPSDPSEIFTNGRWIGRGPQARNIDPPWRDHRPDRVARWILHDIRGGLDPWHATVARVAYHAGVVIGLVDSFLRPGRHWK